MRETVPQDGLANGGMGEEMFTGMLDQHLAPQMGDGWSGGIGEALYRQLRRRPRESDPPERKVRR